ncbi:MAG TPA: ribosome-associated translation inhibitor RaiA [Candidatus Xenobia bacterium]|jgi:putative sigma-54 modulation protein
MHIVVKGKNMDVTEALRQYAEKRLGKISKYFDTIISTDVTLSTERSWHIIEVTVFANGFVLRGEERTNDMYTSIDKVTEKLESQIKKHKGKVTRKGRTHIADGLQPEPTEGAVAVMTRPEESDLHIEVKRFASQTMTVEQAVKEIEAMDYEFFVFFNSSNGRVNVLYRRQRGYGLIDPVE